MKSSRSSNVLRAIAALVTRNWGLKLLSLLLALVVYHTIKDGSDHFTPPSHERPLPAAR